MDKVHYGEVTSFNESSTVLGICDGVRLNNNKNSSGDEIANANFFYDDIVFVHVEASAYAH